jgi:hypothetical protein
MKREILFDVRVTITATSMNRLTGRIPMGDIADEVAGAISAMDVFEGADVCTEVLPERSKMIAG